MKISITVIALFLTNLVYGQYGWVQKASMNMGRYAAVGFSIGNKGYVGTGYNTANQTQSDFWEWDQATNVWTQKANITNSRFGAASFVINGFGYVGLGLTTGVFYNDLQRYDPLTNTWLPRASLPASGRYGSASFAINNKGYIACGNLGSAAGAFTNQLWEYDPLLDSWTQKTAFPALSRYGCRGTSYNDLGYVFGGLNGTGTSSSSFFNDLWEYDGISDSWSQKPNMPGIERSYASTFILDGKVVAGAGVHWTGLLADFYAFDPSTNSWSTLPSLPSAPRWAASAFDIGGNGYLATGILVNNTTTPEFWELSFIIIDPPVITANGNGGDLGCNPNLNDIDVALGSASITGGCNASIVVDAATDAPVNTNGCYYSVTRNFTATDSCGNAADPVSVTVTYKMDTGAPTITADMNNSDIGCNPTALQIESALGNASGIDNCDASVIVNTFTDAPVNTTGCLWSVTRTFSATDSCGNSAIPVQVTVTYKADTEAPEITTTKTNDDLGCNPASSLIESYLGDATALDNCDGSVNVNVSTANAVNTGGCNWSVTRTFSATDACGTTASETVTITYQVDTIAPVVTCNATGDITVCDGSSVVINSSASDCSANLAVTCTRSDGLAMNAPYSDGVTTITCSSTDDCGNTGTCTMTVTVECNDDNNLFCTYTQGAYGNAGGTHCDGNTTTPFLLNLLSTPLIIGGPVNNLTLTSADVSSGCIYTRLKGGGASKKLAGAATCSNPVGIVLNGTKFKNALLNQTITLGLNLRISGSTLGGLALDGQYMTTFASTGTGCNSTSGVAIPGTSQFYTFPLAVITYLGANNTVADLYNLANLALGGIYTGSNPSKTQIAAAVNIINNAFDECRILGEFSDNPPHCRIADLANIESEELTVKAYPNPFYDEAKISFTLNETGSDVSVEVYNLTGQKIANLYNGYAEADKEYVVTIDPTTLLPGVYIYYVRTNNAVFHDKLTLIK